MKMTARKYVGCQLINISQYLEKKTEKMMTRYVTV